jgi:hypothetical protein
MTIYPMLKVEIAFQSDPYASSPTWTDVSSKVRGEVSVKRGRNFEQSKNEAGSASLALENIDGAFDPLNTASPYAPYVLPYRPIRITAIADAFGTSYPIFRGFVERWPQTWAQAGNYGTVQITAVDATKTALARKFGLRYFEQVGIDKAEWYFRFNATIGRDANSGQSAGVTVTDVAGTDTGSATYTLPGPSGGDDAKRIAWTSAANLPDNTSPGTTATYTDNSTGGGRANGSICVEEVWWKPESIPTTAGQFMKVIGRHVYTLGSDSGANTSVEAVFDPTGAYYQLRYFPSTGTIGTGTAVAGSTAVRPTAGRWDHIAVRMVYTSSTNKTYELYVNGVLIVSTTQTSNATLATSCGALGGAFNVPAGFACQWAEWATYTSGSGGNVSVSGIQNRATYQSNYAEFGAQTSSARVSTLLDAIGWPVGLRSIETGASTVQATGSLSGKTAADVLAAAADDELGNVFVDGSGRVVFHARAHRNSATSVATFGEGPGEVPYEEGVQVDFDETYVYNRVEVTQSGVTPSYVSSSSDLASQAVYGLRVLTRSTSASAAADVDGQAVTLLARYKQPVARMSTLPVEIRSKPTLIGAVLAREIGELATVKRRPIGAPVITLQAFIDGVEDKISTTAWTRTFLLTPKFANATY